MNANIVYIARGYISYEGYDLLGVFETKEAAVERCHVRHREDDRYYSYYDVAVWTLGRTNEDELIEVVRTT